MTEEELEKDAVATDQGHQTSPVPGAAQGHATKAGLYTWMKELDQSLSIRTFFSKPGWIADTARTELMIHAVEIFARQGVKATIVQQILESANVSRRTFYKYFRSKLDLLAACYEQGLRLLMLRWTQALTKTQTLDELVDRLVSELLCFSTNFGRALVVMHYEAFQPNSPLAGLRNAMLSSTVSLMREHLRRLTGHHFEDTLLYPLTWMLERVAMETALLQDTKEWLIPHTSGADLTKKNPFEGILDDTAVSIQPPALQPEVMKQSVKEILSGVFFLEKTV